MPRPCNQGMFVLGGYLARVYSSRIRQGQFGAHFKLVSEPMNRAELLATAQASSSVDGLTADVYLPLRHRHWLRVLMVVARLNLLACIGYSKVLRQGAETAELRSGLATPRRPLPLTGAAFTTKWRGEATAF